MPAWPAARGPADGAPCSAFIQPCHGSLRHCLAARFFDRTALCRRPSWRSAECGPSSTGFGIRQKNRTSRLCLVGFAWLASAGLVRAPFLAFLPWHEDEVALQHAPQSRPLGVSRRPIKCLVGQAYCTRIREIGVPSLPSNWLTRRNQLPGLTRLRLHRLPTLSQTHRQLPACNPARSYSCAIIRPRRSDRGQCAGCDFCGARKPRRFLPARTRYDAL